MDKNKLKLNRFFSIQQTKKLYFKKIAEKKKNMNII